MSGKIIQNVKYIALLYDNNLKLESLNKCLYYTLKDIFWNAEEEYITLKAVELNIKLTNNGLNNLNLKQIYNFLNSLDEISFYFYEDISFNKDELYIEFNVWFEQLKLLIKDINNLLINI